MTGPSSRGDDEPGSSEPSPEPTERTGSPSRGTGGEGPPWLTAVVVGAVVVVALAIFLGRRGDNDHGVRAVNPSTGAVEGTDEQEPEAKKPPRTWPGDMKWKASVLGVREDSVFDVSPDVAPGVYVWTDFDGWHTWIVGPAELGITGGRVTVDSEFGSAEQVDGGSGGFQKNESVIEFDFNEMDHRVTGFRYNPGFFTSLVSYEFDGAVPPMFLGHKAVPMDPPLEFEKKVR